MPPFHMILKTKIFHYGQRNSITSGNRVMGLKPSDDFPEQRVGFKAAPVSMLFLSYLCKYERVLEK